MLFTAAFRRRQQPDGHLTLRVCRKLPSNVQSEHCVSAAGNGLMAIFSGLAGNYLVGSLKLGPVAPFDAAIVVLVLGGAIISSTWLENYGDTSKQSGLAEQFSDAFKLIRRGASSLS